MALQVYIGGVFYPVAVRYPSVFPVFFLLALLLTGAQARAQSAATGQEGAAGISNLRDLARGVPAVMPHGRGEGTRHRRAGGQQQERTKREQPLKHANLAIAGRRSINAATH